MNIFIHTHPEIIYFFALVFGGCFGSFLNVVIYRLPLMLETQWKNECELFLHPNAPLPQEARAISFNLAFPASHCPSCQHPLKWFHNIPILSFLALKGRCSFCKKQIGWQYPFVELLTACLTCFVLIQYDFSWGGLSALLFCYLLIILTFIDAKHQILPDPLVYLLLWTGLFLNTYGLFIDLRSAVFGAIIGYSSLATLLFFYKQITGKEGMGHGDFKLLAAFGAWFGWQKLLLIVLVSSFLGALIGSLLLYLQKGTRNTPIPFGPFLSFAAFITLFWGDTLIDHYLQSMHLLH